MPQSRSGSINSSNHRIYSSIVHIVGVHKKIRYSTVDVVRHVLDSRPGGFTLKARATRGAGVPSRSLQTTPHTPFDPSLSALLPLFSRRWVQIFLRNNAFFLNRGTIRNHLIFKRVFPGETVDLSLVVVLIVLSTRTLARSAVLDGKFSPHATHSSWTPFKPRRLQSAWCRLFSTQIKRR